MWDFLVDPVTHSLWYIGGVFDTQMAGILRAEVVIALAN